MQCLAGEVQQKAAQRFWKGAGDGGDASEIDRVSDNRMAAGAEVDSDLVGAAGIKATLEQGDGGMPGAYGVVVGESRPTAAVGANSHALTVAGVAADGGLNCA